MRELDVPEGGKVLTLGVQPTDGSDSDSPLQSTKTEEANGSIVVASSGCPVDALTPVDKSRLAPEQPVVVPPLEPEQRPSVTKHYDDSEVKDILRRHESVLESLQRSQKKQVHLLQALMNSHPAETPPASAEFQKQLEMRQQEIQELNELLGKRNEEIRHHEKVVGKKMQRMELEIEERSNANKKAMLELEEMRDVLQKKEVATA